MRPSCGRTCSVAKKPLGDLNRADAFGLAGAAGDGREADKAVGAHPRKRRAVALEVEEVGWREVVGGALVLLEPDHLHQPVGLRILERPQQHGLHTLKIAVVAPMPSESVTIAITAKPGRLMKLRKA